MNSPASGDNCSSNIPPERSLLTSTSNRARLVIPPPLAARSVIPGSVRQ
jgi:hypothetical protein